MTHTEAAALILAANVLAHRADQTLRADRADPVCITIAFELKNKAKTIRRLARRECDHAELVSAEDSDDGRAWCNDCESRPQQNWPETVTPVDELPPHVSDEQREHENEREARSALGGRRNWTLNDPAPR